MSAVGADDTAHAHGRGAFEQALSNQAICLGDAREATSDGQDAVVDALNNLADAGAHTSLIAQVSDVLARLADDDSGLLGRDNGTQGELRLGVLFFSARGSFALAIDVEAFELVGDAAGVLAGAGLGLFGGHVVGDGLWRAAAAVSDVVSRHAQYHDTYKRKVSRGFRNDLGEVECEG
jgi:hypothetical protein